MSCSRWDLIAKALRLDLHKERFVYGGSTITQQLVKNLFLTREKTLSRKLEELIISWQMERHFSKEELLTFYLNVIEYGPDLYGIRRAAAFYFGKAPAHLTPAEGISWQPKNPPQSSSAASSASKSLSCHCCARKRSSPIIAISTP